MEDQIAKQMAEITGDAQWATGKEGRKTLALEHKMAARRMGYEVVFAPLYAVEHLNTALLDGTLPFLKVFFDGGAPIVAAAHSDDFTFMEAVLLRCPNDEEAGGFLFSYEKLFSVTLASVTNMKNAREGNENSLSRTQRLLYVICSRAEESLAIVVYSAQPEIAIDTVIDAGWLAAEEVVVL